MARISTNSPSAVAVENAIAMAVSAFEGAVGQPLLPIIDDEIQKFLANKVFGGKGPWAAYVMRLITKEEMRNRLLFELEEWLRDRQPIPREPMEIWVSDLLAAEIDDALFSNKGLAELSVVPVDDCQELWALYPWDEMHGVHLIHPDDLELVRDLRPYGRIFEVIELDADFVRLRCGDREFRADPSFLQRIELTPLRIGAQVRLHDGRSACVIDARWHYKRAEPFYLVKVEGRKSSKRYWASDFDSDLCLA